MLLYATGFYCREKVEKHEWLYACMWKLVKGGENEIQTTIQQQPNDAMQRVKACGGKKKRRVELRSEATKVQEPQMAEQMRVVASNRSLAREASKEERGSLAS